MEQQHLFRSTLQHFDEFINSSVWFDLLAELEVWLEDIRSQLETSSEQTEMLRHQGRAEAVRHFMNLPNEIVRVMKENMNKQREA